MLKRYFCKTQDYNVVIFADENGQGVYIDESAFDEPLTLEVAKEADYSNFDGCETAEEAAANYGTGAELIEFNPDDFEEVIEF